MKLAKKIGFITMFLTLLLPALNTFAETYYNPAEEGVKLEYSVEFKVGYRLEVGDIVEVDWYSSHSFSYNDIKVNGKKINPGDNPGRHIIKFTATQEMVDYNGIYIAVSQLNPSISIENILYNIYVNGVEVFNGDVYNGEPDRDGDGIPDDEDEFPDDPTNTPPPKDDNDNGIPDDEEPMEVRNLQIKVTNERADLSWKNPPRNFDKAIIYRRTIGEIKTASVLDLIKPMTVSASEDYKPLFETNGTTFSDLTIEPSTEYAYKVTSKYNGMESAGVIVKMAVPKPPLLPIDEELPFGVKELIASGSGLLGVIGGFILLALSFVFAPKIIELIKREVKKRKVQQERKY